MTLLQIKLTSAQQAYAMVFTACSALILAFIAWRGRRVGDHPHCRRCGFDLFMKPPDAMRCPECGAELLRERAICLGQRHPYKALRVYSTSALLLVIVVGAAWGYRAVHSTDWLLLQPLWWVEHQADSSIAQTRDAALVELIRRARNGTLPQERESALLNRALAYQADMNRPWARGWGDLVQSLRQLGRVNETLWDQYELNAVQLHLEPSAPAMRDCDGVKFVVVHGPDRIGSAWKYEENLFVAMFFAEDQVALGPSTRPAWMSSGTQWSIVTPPDEGSRRAFGYVIDLSSTRDADMSPTVSLDSEDLPPPGPQHVSVTVMLRGSRFWEATHRVRFHGSPRTVNIACDWTMASSPAEIHDPVIGRQILAAAVVHDLSFARQSRSGDPIYDGWTVSFTIDTKPSPINQAYKVFAFIPSENQDYFLTTIYLPAGSAYHRTCQFDGQFWKDAMRNDTILLHLIASPDKAPIGTTTVWDESLRFTEGKPAEWFVPKGHSTWIYGPAKMVFMKP